jgi:hypothetical protein
MRSKYNLKLKDKAYGLVIFLIMPKEVIRNIRNEKSG